MDLATKPTTKCRLRRSNKTMPEETTNPTQAKFPLRRTKTMPIKLLDYSKQRAVGVVGNYKNSTAAKLNRKSLSPHRSTSRKLHLSVTAAADAASEILKQDISKESTYLPLISISSPKSPLRRGRKPTVAAAAASSCVPLSDDSCSTHDTNRMCYLPLGSLSQHTPLSSRQTTPYNKNRSGPKGMSIQLTDRLLNMDDSTSSLLADCEDAESPLKKSPMDTSSCHDDDDSSSSSSDSDSDDSDSESESENPLHESFSSSSSSSDESSSSESAEEDSDDDKSLALSELSEEDHTSMTTSLSFCDDAGSNHGSICFSLRKKNKANAAPSASAVIRGQSTVPVPSAIRLQRSLSKMLTAVAAKTGDDNKSLISNDSSRSNNSKRRAPRKAHSFGTGYLIPSEAATALGPHSTCDEILKSMPRPPPLKKKATSTGSTTKRDPVQPLVHALTAHPSASTRLDKKSSHLNSSSSKLSMVGSKMSSLSGHAVPPPPAGGLLRTRSAGASLGAQLDRCSARMLIDKCSRHSGGRLMVSPFQRSNTIESVDTTYSEVSCSTMDSSISSFWNSTATDCDAATFAGEYDNESSTKRKSDDEASASSKRKPPMRSCSLGTLAAMMKKEHASRQSLTMGNSNHTSRSLNAGLGANSSHHDARRNARRRHSRNSNLFSNNNNGSSRSLNGLKDLDSSTRSLGTLGRLVQQNSSRSLGAAATSTTHERRANRRRVTRRNSGDSTSAAADSDDLNNSTRSTGALGRLLLSDHSNRSLNGGDKRRQRRRRLKKTQTFAEGTGNGSSRSLNALPMADTSENLEQRRRRSSRSEAPPSRRKSFTSLSGAAAASSSSNTDASASLFVTGSRIRRIEINATCA